MDSAVIVGGLVVVRRTVAVGALLGDCGLAKGGGAVAGIERELGEHVVAIGLDQAILAAVGEGEGFLDVSEGLAALVGGDASERRR